MIVLRASDIAKLIGENKYESRTESLCGFWKKNNVESYKKAMLLFTHEQSLDSLIHQAMKSVDVKADIKVAAAQCDPVQTKLAVQAASSKVGQAIESLSGVSEKRKQDAMKKANEAVKSEIYMKQGSFHETAGLNKFENTTNRKVSQRNNKLYSKFLHSGTGNKYKIVGRCDGVDMDTQVIIEHKHRVNRLFQELPNYERIQLIIYMFLTNMKKSELIQHCRGCTESLAVVEWDDDVWAILKFQCDEFVDDYLLFLDDENRQLALLNEIENGEVESYKFDNLDELNSAFFCENDSSEAFTTL